MTPPPVTPPGAVSRWFENAMNPMTESRRIGTAAGARYMGADRGRVREAQRGAGELVVRIHVENFVGDDDVTG